ncbi:phage integrase SAM-like domain and Arm DNA-binding domain-containing protein [Flavobacterium limi]|uniref:Phage integrase SAM-like domain-containing protein n=1 Tax=Flavobacterium limi TaxID=2045105 RepID=A0ABQ1UYG3_9FLAO|nr:phage integrase SAM-like domain and Arm DNA-binding domain-containing protein [Flavobacterium limi]GGF28851.1 hypothetical protein GCM10011518_42680 [Flavobacterium limi]
MSESSFGLVFFLKTTSNDKKIKTVYFRITVDGITKEASTKRKWENLRWDQKAERATGSKEDAKSLNYFLDSLTLKINVVKTEMMHSNKIITAEKIMDEILGRTAPRVKVLEEFQKHNDEMEALLGKGYAKGTLDRFTITKNHLTAFIKYKFNKSDHEFADLSLEFVKDFEFYLRTVRNCSNNTTLKYIANFKKIVIRAIDKEIITKDPFKNFKGRKTKMVKKPLTRYAWKEVQCFRFRLTRK